MDPIGCRTGEAVEGWGPQRLCLVLVTCSLAPLTACKTAPEDAYYLTPKLVAARKLPAEERLVALAKIAGRQRRCRSKTCCHALATLEEVPAKTRPVALFNACPAFAERVAGRAPTPRDLALYVDDTVCVIACEIRHGLRFFRSSYELIGQLDEAMLWLNLQHYTQTCHAPESE